MRRCVFLAALLALVLSLSKGQDATTPTTTATNTTGSSSDTTPTPNSTTATNTTGSTSETNSTSSSPATTETPGENATTPTTTVTDTTGENDTINTTTPTTTAANTTGENATTPTTTVTDTTGGNDTINTTTPTTTAANTTGENATTPTTTVTDTTGGSDTINTTTPTTTAANTTGENATTPTTTVTDTTGGSDTINTTTPTTTAANTTGENAINATTLTTTSAATTGNFCNPDPCGTDSATCVSLNSTFTCQCQYGFYYSDNDCHAAKVFPGVITLRGNYDSSVLTVNSAQYEEMFENITHFFQYAFRILPGFEQTVIVEIQLLTEVRASTGARVTVINLFMENTTADNETVSSAVTNATANFSFVVQYTGITYCSLLDCDAETTVCEENEFPQCVCRSNFSKTEWDVNTCSGCNKDCFEKENTYCAKENGIPTCKCMPDFEPKGEKCVPCRVGYSGNNCENNSELILIIVGTVLGAICLCLAIAVAVVSIRAKHKQDPEKKKLLKSGYYNPDTSDDRQPTMFPRVRTTTGHANPGYQPNNPYEMRDFDDLYEASEERGGFRMRNRN